MSYDDFMNHKSRNYGDKLKVIRSWKEKESLDIWLHRKFSPRPLWMHQFPQLVVLEEKESKAVTKHFWGKQYVCWERTEINENAWKRIGGRTGPREYPPERCPLCKMVEHVRMSVYEGKLDWFEPLFAFKGSSPDKKGQLSDKVLHAAGLFNGYPKAPNDEDLKHAKEHRIELSKGYQEKALADCHYLSLVVHHQKPEDGLQVLIQPDSVGDKIKKCMKRERASNGEKGDISKYPYCIRLTHNGKALKAEDYYDAARINLNELSEGIDKLISSDSPDISKFFEPFNGDSLRGFVEKYALKDLGWDAIFKEKAPTSSYAMPTQTAPAAEQTPAQTKAEEPEKIPCDRCGNPMLETESVCAKCGMKYEFAAEATNEAPAGPVVTTPHEEYTDEGDVVPF